MSSRWDKDWDEEPYGDPDLGRRRRWRRPWNVYLCYTIGAFGLFMTSGAVAVGSVRGIAAGLCLRRRTRGPGPGRRPPRRSPHSRRPRRPPSRSS